MCLGIPMQVCGVGEHVAQCRDGDRLQDVDISLIAHPEPGDWLLVHLGTARQVLDARDARQIREALDAVGLVMQGQLPDAAAIDRLFADLVDREPPLPPHLDRGGDADDTFNRQEPA